ncbi:MAG: ROK family transcriptional regulator [Anaerolineales bacterium]|nr:ROK family transcriptional regulator [Anaerolineales bacterium]
MNCLRSEAPLSRAEIASKTGLNRSTISSIISDLLDVGFIRETELQGDRIGRPGMLLELDPHGGAAIGVEIGVNFVSIILTNFTAKILYRNIISSNPNDDQLMILQKVEAIIEEGLSAAADINLNVLGIGIGVPGLVDRKQGKLVFAPNLGWHDIPIRLIITNRFGYPVFLENEAKSAALGELRYGVAQNIQNMIYLSAGVGLGGGIVINGKLYWGANGYAGEIGHTTIYEGGEKCSCGRIGCWETYVGPRAVTRKVRQTILDGADSILRDITDSEDLYDLSMEMVVQAAQENDRVALNALKDVGKHLGVGISNLVNTFNPEMVVLGGLLNLASPFILPVIEEIVGEETFRPLNENLAIVSSAHKTDACLMGAIASVLDEVFVGPSIG